MLTLRDVIAVIFKRKMVIAVFMAALVVGAVLTLKIMTPTYAATAKILVKIGREDVYTPSMAPDALVSPLLSLVRKEQLNSEIQILTSDNLAEKLIGVMTPEGLYPGLNDKHPFYTFKGIMQRLVRVYKFIEGYFAPLSANLTPEEMVLKRFLTKDLKAVGTGDSNVIAVTVKSKIPALAAKAANTLVDLYLEERMRIHSGSEGAIFESEMRALEGRLKTAENSLKVFRETHSITQNEAERKRLEQNVQILKKSRELYLEKVEEYKINTALSNARIGNVSVISRAIPPLAPAGLKLWLILLALAIVGPVGGIALAFLLEILDDSVETDADVRKYLGLPVLGKIGYLD